MSDHATLRRLEPQWNYGMVLASIAISLLGAFTSTQLFVFHFLGRLRIMLSGIVSLIVSSGCVKHEFLARLRMCLLGLF